LAAVALAADDADDADAADALIVQLSLSLMISALPCGLYLVDHECQDD
jgi:hypothetical protein